MTSTAFSHGGSMDITSINALDRALAAKFETQRTATQVFPVRIDARVSETVEITASTIEEAKMKAKQAAQERFEADLLIQIEE